MTAPELKPCPFCGEESNDHDFDTSWVRCLGCGAESGWGTPAEAVAAWNRRTASVPTDTRLVTVAQLEMWASQDCEDFVGEIRSIIEDNDNG